MTYSRQMVMELDGKKHTLEKWAELKGLNVKTVIERLRNGKTLEQALYPKKHVNGPGQGMRVTVDGETHTIIEWARVLGIKANTLWSRLRYCTPEQAVRMGTPRAPKDMTSNRLVAEIRREEGKLNGIFPAYRHYMLARKCTIGAFPGEGFQRFYNLPSHCRCEEAGAEVYAVLWYDRMLTEEERANYDISKGYRVT